MPLDTPRTAAPEFILVMGVAGVGKSTIARRIAEAAGGRFVEADDHHSPENVRRMVSGRALTDDQRWPWLEKVAAAARGEHERHGRPVVIACSALKRRYRDYLRDRIGPLAVVYLRGERDLIHQRMAARTAHFMPPALLESQLADLEEPDSNEADVVIDIGARPQEIVAGICRHLGLAGDRVA